MAKQTRTENVILESLSNIELLVTYSYEYVLGTEECHGYHNTSYTDIDIEYVELVIAGESVTIKGTNNLVMSLTPKQRSEIESSLQVYE